jgi:hypothetical protein
MRDASICSYNSYELRLRPGQALQSTNPTTAWIQRAHHAYATVKINGHSSTHLQ